MTNKSDIAVSVRGLSKSYTIAHNEAKHSTMGEALVHKLRNPLQKIERETFWALKDVDFDIQKGDVVGIIGRNGAGKSTLLKVLSRITEPTRGKAILNGRVGSLLEVGTGFHAELTGRENIFLNGAILGMSKREIAAQFDAIVDFSGTEQFLDTPVKRYSSGMAVRLAFAVAAHLKPEILLVDEVLTVGDQQFQKKCIGKMHDVSREGRTVIFVSHDMRAVKNLCNSGIYLKAGRIAMKASTEEVFDKYSSDAKLSGITLPVQAKDVIIHCFEVTQNGSLTNHIDGSHPFNVRVAFELLQNLSCFRIGVYFKTIQGDTLTRSFIADWDPDRETLGAGTYESSLRFPGNLIMPGTYRIVLHASRYGIESYLDKADLQQEITVTAPSKYNEAHLGEARFESVFLIKNGWDFRKGNSFNEYVSTAHHQHTTTISTSAA